MNFNNYTIKATESIQDAQNLALTHDHSQIDTPHLLLALFQQKSGYVPQIITGLGLQVNSIEDFIKEKLESLPRITGEHQLSMSTTLAKVLALAEQIMKDMWDQYITTEHLFLAILKDNNIYSDYLKSLSITYPVVLQAVQNNRNWQSVTSNDPESTQDALSKYARNLSELARQGKLDPVIGRDDEIRRTIQILSRRTKNNPCLVWDPGVGKTAIVEGLAQKIANWEVPDTLIDKQIYELDMWLLIAGAKYQWEFEERLKAIIKEATDSDGLIIIFIDEIHTVIGAGKTQGAMDMAQLLKPALARWQMKTIGATTLAEYRKHIEKDPALERRFQPVAIDEPNIEDAITILRGIKWNYERHHGVKISDAAVVAAVELSTKYISDRFLPDKAIDLIDEAGASVKMNLYSAPDHVTKLERQIKQLEVEKNALIREDNKKNENRLNNIEKDLAQLQEEYNTVKTSRESTKNLVDRMKSIKDEINSLNIQADQALQRSDYNTSAEITYGKIPALQKELEEVENTVEKAKEDGTLSVDDQVDPEDIAHIISRWTGIPASKLVQSDIDKLLKLEDHLRLRVVGQDHALEIVADAIRRARSGLNDPNKPLGSFIFAWPTWVGKTELAKALAEFMFDDKNHMIRIDMSEYMEKHTVARLIGSPPGYVGYEEWGQLTDAVRRKPYSVILFDEIEKAHPDVFHLLLQILDDGRLTDSHGRTVNFTNTIVIMTTNLDEDKITTFFRPEFINRIDEIVHFSSLDKWLNSQIVKIQLDSTLSRIMKEKQITITYNEKVLDYLIDKWFDEQFGARPLKRAIQKYILDPLAMEFIKWNIETENKIAIDVKNDKIIIKI